MVYVFKDNDKEAIVTANDDKQIYGQSEIAKIKAVDKLISSHCYVFRGYRNVILGKNELSC